MIRQLPIIALAVFIIGVGSATLADDAVMTTDGAVHSVTYERWQHSNLSSGTVLVHRIQFPDGNVLEQNVPGTDDYAPDINPVLDVDPVTDQPVLVWSRNEGSGFGMYLARFEETGWTAPALIHGEDDYDLEIQLRIRQNLIQVYWEKDRYPDVHIRRRLAIDRRDLQPVFGPEDLPINDSGVGAVPATGEEHPDSTVDPTGDMAYFASNVPSLDPSNPVLIVVWGVRDDPVVVGYIQTFDLPAGVQNAQKVHTDWIADHFMVWFTYGGDLYYTFQNEGTWSDFRLLEMEDGMTTAQAIDIIEQMLEREEQTQPE